MTNSPVRLTQLTAARIVMVSAIVLSLSGLNVIYENVSDHDKFTASYISMAARQLAASVTFANGRFTVEKKLIPSHYRGAHLYYYSFRIRDPNGRVIAASNSQILENAYPMAGLRAAVPYSWDKAIEPTEWFYIAGGRPVAISNHQVWIEVATLGDPAKERLRAIWWQLRHEIWYLFLPLVLATLGLVVFTVQRALAPVVKASLAVEEMDGDSIHLAIDHDKLPLELAVLTRSIDRLMQRNASLMQAQKRLLAHAAHELRTPLAVMMMELGRSTNPKEQRLQEDVHRMRGIVDRLLSLGRLDAIGQVRKSEVDPAAIVEAVVRASMPVIEDRKCTIEVVDGASEGFSGDPTSIHDAVRNVVENAIMHSPIGSRIRVTHGPHATVTVEDSGPGFPDLVPQEQLFEVFRKGDESSEGAGLGLAIVKRAVDLHGGRISIGQSALGGTRIELLFNDFKTSSPGPTATWLLRKS